MCHKADYHDGHKACLSVDDLFARLAYAIFWRFCSSCSCEIVNAVPMVLSELLPSGREHRVRTADVPKNHDGISLSIRLEDSIFQVT